MTSPATSTLTALVLFVPRLGDEEAESALEAIKARAPHLELVAEDDWYERAFSSSGSWEAFALETVTGKSYQTKRPYFAGFFVVGEGFIENERGQIVQLALAARKPVYVTQDGERITLVRAALPSPDGIRLVT